MLVMRGDWQQAAVAAILAAAVKSLPGSSPFQNMVCALPLGSAALPAVGESEVAGLQSKQEPPAPTHTPTQG